MRRAPLPSVFVIVALASCATVSGLADKETVDCPGGCPEAGVVPTPTPTSTSPATDDGSIPPSGEDGGDAAPDVQANFTKPDGWALVAVASSAAGANAPACPSGFDDASDVGRSPSAGANTCECATCTVTQQAACTGDPNIVVGQNGVCDVGAGGGSYDNNPAGGCNTDFFTGVDRSGLYAQVKLKPPSGGACTPNPATPHPERVRLTDERRVCDETARCNGNACDATVPAPFAACLASPKGSGTVPCPAGFPNALVAGRANATCGSGGCNCNVTRTPCTGTFTYYKDTDCTLGAAGVVADDTCRNLNASGTYAAYKVAATTTTGCTASGSPPATVSIADVRTICCP